MQDRMRISAMGSRSVLLPAVLLVVAAAFSLLTDSETNAQTESSTALDAPVVTAFATAGSVELSWDAVSGAAGYAVYAWWGEDPGWVRLDDGGVAGTSYTHGDPVPGRTYWYSVCAVDGNGDLGACSDAPFPSAMVSAAGTETPTPTEAGISMNRLAAERLLLRR